MVRVTEGLPKGIVSVTSPTILAAKSRAIRRHLWAIVVVRKVREYRISMELAVNCWKEIKVERVSGLE
jgi:hypothetical protein